MAIDYDPDRLTSPDFNLRVGAFYLNKLFKMFQSIKPPLPRTVAMSVLQSVSQ